MVLKVIDRDVNRGLSKVGDAVSGDAVSMVGTGQAPAMSRKNSSSSKAGEARELTGSRIYLPRAPIGLGVGY